MWDVPIASKSSLIFNASRFFVPCSSIWPRNESSPGAASGMSPAPSVMTSRIVTMGSSWRSTMSTRRPFFSFASCTFGATNVTLPSGPGGCARNAASGVVSTGGGAGGAVRVVGGGAGGGGAGGGLPPQANKNKARGTARQRRVGAGRGAWGGAPNKKSFISSLP